MPTEHVDVLIVGAGLSGIGAACHLQNDCPGKSYVILEGRDSIGGTWDLFRYPGIRSDSDMFTLGYNFRPWEEAKAIADGPSILNYVRDTASRYNIEQNIRFGHKVVRAQWSSEDAHWTVEAQNEAGELVHFTCGFLFGCTGYYCYDEGYTPNFKGVENFKGTVVHPQKWPENLDYRNKRVVIIGSGATAVTLVPAMAEQAEHVTMLQRSPTYIVSLPARDPIANFLRRLLPPKLAYSLVRWKNIAFMMATFQLSRRAPKLMRKLLRCGIKKNLPEHDADIDTHFNPSYNPWDQRLCLVPDSDLFKALKSGRASIITDTIETFTEKGIALRSGEELEADIIITATGLKLEAVGGIKLEVDGEKVDIAERFSYKGAMLSGVPNFAFVFGYTNASWTLKCDLISGYVCRLINYMEQHDYVVATPNAPDPSLPSQPFVDLNAGYILRAAGQFPKQSVTLPWILHQNYVRDLGLLKRGPVDDEMQFKKASSKSSKEASPVSLT